MRRSIRGKGGSTEKSVSPAPAALKRRKKAPDINEDSNDGGASDATDATDVSCSSSLSNLSEVSFKKAFVKLKDLKVKSQATSHIKVTMAKKLTEKKVIEQLNKKNLEKPVGTR